MRQVAAIVGATMAVLCVWRGSLEPVRAIGDLIWGTPHERYAATLLWRGIADTDDGRAWLDAAVASLESPRRASETLAFTTEAPEATSFALTLRRGQRYTAEAQIDDPNARVFLDVFRRDHDALRHAAHARAAEASLVMDVRIDGEYIVRVQPALGHAVRVRLAMARAPTLRLPVQEAQARHIQSYFGDPREGGRREHHGVDIFAPRGTPVLAAGSGIVTSVGTNNLGGNVIWIARPARGESHYYAHLDEQLVSAGTFVNEGDLIGLVGNTGNARATTPHLHFGIYASGGPVDPLPYIAPARGL